MFQPRFAPLVASGSKTQTVRPPRKTPFQEGEIVSARQWSGVAYRSPQIEVARVRIEAIHEVVISEHGIDVEEPTNEVGELEWVDLEPEEVEAFAKDDGFEDWADMREWFRSTHGLPFRGELIRFERLVPKTEGAKA